MAKAKNKLPDFEKLGAFYLGKNYDLKQGKLLNDLVLYDSKDLTTHAVIIGMTGSGKTGLGIGMIEEAAMDHIPVIAIDPKGDLGNLMLTFPKFLPEQFRPWINTREASDKGQTVDEFAKGQAELWKKGLGEWGQDGKRIATLRDNVDLAIYTPGSNAGLPISVLRSFNAPPAMLRDDRDLYRERVQATATGILALLDIDADPVTSREHILISNLLDEAWQREQNLDIASLIAVIQNPPIKRIGVMDIDSFYPANDRFALAMQLNNLLAAPGFEAWMEGEALDTGRLLYTQSGQPRVSIMSIAHLSDSERMFFVAMLLNDLIAWMRAQQGTSSLRAILYMDEIFGYMPPVANPPTKRLLLTLLKQARAYGLGLVLSTQNPVDLDYKGLSNTGTWFIGRLQTERDKARVMEGLEGAAAGGEFDKSYMEQTLAGLGKRKFLLHNVHENEPVVFNTRWAMSYLSGPLTRDQIKTLMRERKAIGRTDEKAGEKAGKAAKSKAPRAGGSASGSAPVLPPKVKQFYANGSGEQLVYYPRVIAAAEVAYSSAKYHIDDEAEVIYTVEIDDGPVPLDWDNGEELALTLDDLNEQAQADAGYAELPAAALTAKNYPAWEKLFKRWLRRNRPITLLKSKAHKMTSTAGESEGEFRARLQQAASERRDLAIAKIRKRYASKTNTLENRLLRAQQAIERESEQSSKRKMDTAISVGTALLGLVLGRKKLSATTAGKFGSAAKSAGSMRKEAGDVERAKATASKVRDELKSLNATLETEIAELETTYNSQGEELVEVSVKAKSTDIHIHFVGLAWLPYQDDGQGRLQSVWE